MNFPLRLLFTSGWVGCSVLAAHARIERLVEKEFAVAGAGTLQVETSGGSITVGDLNGQANLRTSGGSITAGRMGGAVTARTSGGNITLEKASRGRGRLAGAVNGGGPLLKLRASGGSISIRAM